MLYGQEAQGGRPDSPPPTDFNKESWRKAIGLQSPSSGTEVIYGSPDEVWEEEVEEEQEWYEESPEPEPLSPATQKRILEEFKRDVDECTTDSDSIALQSIAQHYGPEGKTMSELDEIIAEYKRTTTESRMQAVRRMDGNSLQHVFAKCLYTVYESRSTEEIARSRPTKIARVSPAINVITGFFPAICHFFPRRLNHHFSALYNAYNAGVTEA